MLGTHLLVKKVALKTLHQDEKGLAVEKIAKKCALFGT
jgi:hypothetical protein